MAVLNNRPRNATATALTECRVFTLDEKSINGILEQRVAVRLLLNIIHVLSDWLEQATAEKTRLQKLVKSLERAS
jgi:CRP-like cAMP-binding protein